MPKRRLVHAFAVVMLSGLCWVQVASQAPQPLSAEGTSLPVRRVVLYKSGVGYFEHQGRVRGNEDVAIRFTTAQLNDVLKSLTAIDLGRGRIAGVSYNSVAPLSQRLNALRLPLDQNAKLTDLLATLRGARVEVASAAGVVSGRLLGVEPRLESNGTATTETQYLSLITPAGEVRTFELTPAVRVRLLDADLREEVSQYLDLVGSTREQDSRRMIIQTVGNGERDLRVSYVSEVPVWKSTYRLVIPESGPALLQGWAIVDNTIGEDWNNVTLSLVAGAPQTFVQEISQPFYTQRPVVPMARNLLLTPQTHQGTLASGPGTLRGVVRDFSGGPLPGARVALHGGPREMAAMTGPNGEYTLEAPAGVYRIEYSLQGFQPVVRDNVVIGGGVERQQDVRMEPGTLSETVNVAAASPLVASRDAASRRGARPGRGFVERGVLGGVVGGLPDAPPPPPPPAPEPAAQAADLGDLFEYRITEPVTIAQNQSALVPIISTPVEVERVSLWNGTARAGRPLRAIWLTNDSGLTLDGGSFSVVDGEAFAGEGLIEPLEPGERRLLSYAADLAVLVSARAGERTGRLMRIRAADGVITRQSEERATWIYSLRNEDSAPRVLVIEHPVRSGWKLAPGMTPAEASPTTHRFRVPLDPGKEVAFEVSESRTGESAIHISNLSDEEIVEWRQAGIDAAALENTVKPVLEKKREMEAYESRRAGLEAERQKIVQDQERLRENMKALRGSSEERQLLRRYTAQLDGQEDRLADLERRIASEIQARDKAAEEFGALIMALSFEYSTGS